MDQLRSTEIRWRVLRSTTSNYVAKLVGLAAGFLLTPFVLHQLGPAGFGLWILVGAIIGYGGLLELGISSAVIRFVAANRATGETERANGLIATALSLYSVLGLVAVALSAIAATTVPGWLRLSPDVQTTAGGLILLMGTGLGVTLPCSTTSSVLRGLQRYDVVSVLGIVATLLSVAGTIVALSLGGGVLGLAAVGIGVTLVMQVPSVWVIRHVAPDLRLGWRGVSRQLLRTVVSFSSSTSLIQVAGRLQTRTDEIVIGAFLPVRSVAPYAVAHRLSEVPQAMTEQFMKVILPLAAELHAEGDRARLKSLYLTSTRITLAAFLPLGCVLMVLARPILAAWVGSEYAEHSTLVVILTLASALDSSLWPAGLVLQGMGRHRPVAVMSVASGLANLALSIALVRPLGLTGVALGTLIPTAVECVALVTPFAMRSIGVRGEEVFREIVWPVSVATVPCLATLYLLTWAVAPLSLLSLAVVAGAGVLSYGIAYLHLGAAAEERRMCVGLVEKAARWARSD